MISYNIHEVRIHPSTKSERAPPPTHQLLLHATLRHLPVDLLDGDLNVVIQKREDVVVRHPSAFHYHIERVRALPENTRQNKQVREQGKLYRDMIGRHGWGTTLPAGSIMREEVIFLSQPREPFHLMGLIPALVTTVPLSSSGTPGNTPTLRSTSDIWDPAYHTEDGRWFDTSVSISWIDHRRLVTTDDP